MRRARRGAGYAGAAGLLVIALLLVVLVALPPATRPLVAAPATVSPSS